MWLKLVVFVLVYGHSARTDSDFQVKNGKQVNSDGRFLRIQVPRIQSAIRTIGISLFPCLFEIECEHKKLKHDHRPGITHIRKLLGLTGKRENEEL